MKLSEKQKAKIKDVLTRSIKTFVQTAAGCITAALAGVSVTDMDAVIGSVAISAIAAGVCAVWNGVLSPLMKGDSVDE